jgi:hypothetical protein
VYFILDSSMQLHDGMAAHYEVLRNQGFVSGMLVVEK